MALMDTSAPGFSPTPSVRYVFEGNLQEPLLILSFEPATDLLYLRWSGATDEAAVKRGAASILEAARDWQARLILNDGGQGLGDWQELVPWLAFELAPQVAAAGIRAVAFLPPASVAGTLAMHTLTEEAPAGVLPMRLFTTEAEARTWLKAYNAPQKKGWKP